MLTCQPFLLLQLGLELGNLVFKADFNRVGVCIPVVFCFDLNPLDLCICELKLIFQGLDALLSITDILG